MGLSKAKRLLLIRFVDNICEECHKKFEDKDFIIHRINRGCNSGEYILRNIKVVCHRCSDLYHANEFKQVRSK